MPSILLNALFLDPGVSGGPESYLRGLAGGLLATCPDARLTVATTRRGAAALSADGFGEMGVKVISLPCDEGQRVRRQVAEQVLLPALARRSRVDVLHSLASVAPVRVSGVAHVITVHDVNFIHHRTFGRVTQWGMSQVVPRAARRADRLITGSAAAQEDISRTLVIPQERFTVIHHGVDRDEPVESAPIGNVLQGIGVSPRNRVVLCVGAIRPHKNQELLVRALTCLPDDVVVVCAGHLESGVEELLRFAGQMGVADRFALPGYLSDSELEALWEHASVAAFPTLGEGFGLPVAEALARGVPVACSDIAVLREVGGDAPLYFDPHSPRSAAFAISELLANPPGPELLVKRGRSFSWDEAAQQTYAVYLDAIGEDAVAR